MHLEFYFDLVSTYSYLASTQMDALAARTGATVVWKPFLLGAVFKATANQSPITNPTKAPHVLKDAMRWADYYGVPFVVPPTFPFNSIKALRLVLVADRQGKGTAAAKAAFQRAWGEGKDIGDEAELRVIAERAGLDPSAALAAIEEPAIKDALRKNTEDAVARGAFGAPSFFVGDELFWGNDRLMFVEKALKAPQR